VTQIPVVILTALNLEYEAVRRRLADVHSHVHERGTRFEIGTVGGGRCRVALALTGKGNQSAGILTERAIEEFSPLVVLFVGVAGALWDATALGDVVMATQVYAYHGGTSEDDGLKARPRAWEASHGLSQLAAHLARVGGWADQPPPGTSGPKVHFGPIAAGEVVHNSRISYEARWIREHYNDALAIEMEGAGVAQAGHLSGAPVAVIRGISDRADGTKSSGADGTWQPRAAQNAAAFAVRLAEELVTEQENTAMRQHSNADGTDSGVGAVRNIGSGVVGIQAGSVTGSTVWIGAAPAPATPAGLIAELEALRDRLARERSSGGIDEATFNAAQAELDIAGNALGTDTAEGRDTFVLALKRLRGLIADVTDLATRIAALLVMAKALS
jgi:adenosylhomocysteine nucleosidase